MMEVKTDHLRSGLLSGGKVNVPFRETAMHLRLKFIDLSPLWNEQFGQKEEKKK